MTSRYGSTALERETAAVVQAAPGDRNCTLNRAALALGQLVAGGALEAEEVRTRLLAAAVAAGLPEREATTTIRSGVAAGAQRPRRERGSEAPQTDRPRQDQEQLRRPPQAEVLALWCAAELPGQTWVDPPRGYLDACAFLRDRGFNLQRVAEARIARVLPDPDNHTYPNWWPASWARTWALVVPAFEPTGQLVSLHARAVVEVPEGAPKTRWPRGCHARGLLFADAAGRRLLRGQRAAARVLIVEGLTDTLRAACWTLAREAQTGDRVAVLGIAAGGAPALRRVRWPGESTVLIATDPDSAGERYAQAIRAALPPTVTAARLRWRTTEAQDHAA